MEELKTGGEAKEGNNAGAAETAPPGIQEAQAAVGNGSKMAIEEQRTESEPVIMELT
jgi:hypothetical protein